MAYSPKVLEHFRKPHNYGKLKEADGIGKVGNVVCLLPTEMIHSQNEIKSLKEIRKGDFVLSHTGRNNIVEQVSQRQYKGEIIKLKSKLGEVKLTPEHLVYAIKIPKGNKFLRTPYRKQLVPAWYHAIDLKKGDMVLYPIVQEETKRIYLENHIEKLKYDFKSIDIPKKIKLDSDILRLFGYYLSEGHISEGKCNNFISFTLHIKENDIVEDIKKAAKKIGIVPVVRHIPDKKTTIVSLYSANLARFLKFLFGKYADHKSIPESLMLLPKEMQKHLLYGIWKGDGYINTARDGARGGYVTISYNLSQQVKMLLLRQGIIPSIYIEKEKKIKGVNHKKSYRIHVGQRDSLEKLCKIMGIKYSPKSYKSEKSWIDNKYAYVPISKIEIKEYSGPVFNLEVQEAHSFTTESFCVHNCGDVMWLYIKVAQDKKGNEIIKDIKFETFGCTAAIATSSMITDLAKGKTLEEALVINKKDIVDSLGGLPPIKMHCSVLANDALAEAIYDYYKKNKKAIPEDLEKKHKRITTEKDVVEEKYKDWTDGQEQINEE